MKKKVRAGIDNIASINSDIADLRLGMITGPSGVTSSLEPSYMYLYEHYNLTALYSPEHGLNGAEQAGGHDENHRDPDTGLPVYSLYGDNSFPPPEYLDKIDVMLFDIQDAGVRYYTYLYTMTRAMRSCARDGKLFVVLDRPNPLSLGRVCGGVLDPAFSSFVGEYPVPVRYGLTVGEFARYVNSEFGINCALTVVPCDGLDRSMYYSDTGLPFVSPSPNIPTPDTCLHYTGTCLFEGTNLSEGRGTTHPFELIGAPWLRSEGVCDRMRGYGFEGILFRRCFFIPLYSKYKDQVCEGIQLHMTDRDRYQPYEVALRLLDEIRAEFIDFEAQPFLDHIFGSDALRKKYIGRQAIDGFLAGNSLKLEAFRESSRPYFLY